MTATLHTLTKISSTLGIEAVAVYFIVNVHRYDYYLYRSLSYFIEWLHCKLQTRPLVREGAPQIQDCKFQTATFRQEVIFGLRSHKDARYQDTLTDWPTVSRKVTNFMTDGQSVMSWCRAHSGSCDQILFPVGRLLSESRRLVSGGALSDEKTGLQFAV
jgi:hypothetical protein